jgi:hypothetical protein
MLSASLVLSVVLGQVPASDPAELVARLGAARYAEREASAAALEKLGRPALAALRGAREVKDPEIRTRAAALVVKIEGNLLTQASMVKLDFEHAPLPEVLKSLSDQTGIKLSLIPENAPVLLKRRVNLHEANPLPFWQALDRLCDAAHLQYNFGMHSFPSGREPSFPLFDGNARPTTPVYDSGPFRVAVVGLHYQRDVQFQPTNLVPGRGIVEFTKPAARPATSPQPSITQQLYAQLQVAGEPRLTLAQNGPMKIAEAVDDKGNVLVAPPAPGNSVGIRASGYFGFATGSSIQVQAQMVPPDQLGKTIKSLKGTLPVAVSTRKPNPLVVSLAGAAGRTFQNEDVSLTVRDVRTLRNTNQTSIELAIRPTGGNGATPAPVGGFGPNEAMFQRPDSYQPQVEVVDAQGRALPVFQTGFDGESGRLTLTLASPDPIARATELRFYSLIRAATDVAFEFHDVPLP